jgi:hypothetical protein
MLAFTVGGQQTTSFDPWLDDGNDDEDNDDEGDSMGFYTKDSAAKPEKKESAAKLKKEEETAPKRRGSKESATKLGKGLFGGLNSPSRKKPLDGAAAAATNPENEML